MFKQVVVLFGLLFTLGCKASTVHIVSSEAGVDITTNKIATILDVIDGQQDAHFAYEMATTAKMTGDRVILINSPGGGVTLGQDMIDMMRAEQAHGVKEICVVGQYAHSMAFNFLTFCDVRLALPDARFVVHNIALGGLDGSEGRITAKKLREIANDMDKMEEPYRQANCKAMHLGLDEYDTNAAAQTDWTAGKLYIMGYLNGFATVETQ